MARTAPRRTPAAPGTTGPRCRSAAPVRTATVAACASACSAPGPPASPTTRCWRCCCSWAFRAATTKPLAKSLINGFGSLAAVLSASPEALAREGGLDAQCVAVIRLPELAALRLSGAEVRDRPVLNNWDRLLAYFETALTGAVPGQLRILFLDNRNRLLADEVIEDASATIAGLEAEQPDPSRQAMRRALDLHATALILVRIVAAGALAKPLLAREAGLAARVARSASPLAIVLHDHMLVGGENWVSLRQKGLL